MGFSRAQLESFRDATVPDLIGPGLRLLFVGINPGLWTAAARAHFARPGNRFFPALERAGIIDGPLDASDGMSAGDEGRLIERGIGIKNLVARATARADELSTEELRDGRVRLEALVAEHAPQVVAVAGITAFRTAFAAPRAAAGPQPEGIGQSELWVVANPSGLNAHETVDTLAVSYAAVARAAGVLPGG